MCNHMPGSRNHYKPFYKAQLTLTFTCPSGFLLAHHIDFMLRLLSSTLLFSSLNHSRLLLQSSFFVLPPKQKKFFQTTRRRHKFVNDLTKQIRDAQQTMHKNYITKRQEKKKSLMVLVLLDVFPKAMVPRKKNHFGRYHFHWTFSSKLVVPRWAFQYGI